MRSRKNNRAGTALALIALVVGLVGVSPGSAIAKAGGTDRPIKGTAAGTVRLNLLTHDYVAEVSMETPMWVLCEIMGTPAEDRRE